MLHTLKVANVLYHYFTERALGPVSLFDQAGHFSADFGVIEYAQIDIKQGVVFLVQYIL